MSKYIKVTDVELGGSVKIGDIELSNTDLAGTIDNSLGYKAAKTYALGQFASYDGKLYVSQAADNTGQLLTDPVYWKEFVSGGTPTLSAISGDAFLYPKTGVVNPFTNANKTPNVVYNVSSYADNVVLLSTSASEPLQLPKFVIPADTISLKFRFVYAPESTKTWNTTTVVWAMQYKKMTNDNAWGSVVTKNIGTNASPASGSNPQLYEVTISLATLGLAVGDVVQSVVYVDETSTWADKIAFSLCEIEVVI